MKKYIIFGLIITLLFTLAAPAMAALAPFPDVYDGTTQFETDVLRLLGVVGGDERGYFNPGKNLNRAEFCKMAVVIMGKGADEPLYRSRTIFSDVRGDHWARGYINLAVTGDVKIIQGNGDGTFRPDERITYAQAVTILLRILGYTDLDAGMLWPQGYIALAKSTGLSSGLDNLSADMAITRAQAAKLFCNMLRTDMKSGAPYPTKLGTTVPNAVILELDVKNSDGSRVVKASTGTYKIKNEVPLSLLGKKGTLIIDSNMALLGFVPAAQSFQTVTVASAHSSWIIDSSGIRHNISATAKAYMPSETSDEYSTLWTKITAGTQVTLYYDQRGTVEEVYINSSSSDTALVAKNPVNGNPFTSLLGGDTQYTIIKNGTPATVADIRQYDVATYDKAAKILRISDFRITSCYEKAEPNQEAPTSIWVMGVKFAVLPSAVNDVASFRVGQVVTFLFTADNKIAGAVSPNTVMSTAVGVVEEASGSSATVELLNGLRVSGNPGLSSFEAENYVGEIVTVSSSRPGQITLAPLTSSITYGQIDLVNKTMGGTPFSQNIKIYERVGRSEIVSISLEDLTQKTISASKIVYASKDYSGKIGTLILNDVTGDLYTYGILKDETTQFDENRRVTVINGGSAPTLVTGMPFTSGVKGGIVADATGSKTAGIVELLEIRNVSRSSFRTENGKVIAVLTDMEIPVAQGVLCYNKTTGTWFKSLDEARAYADKLTLYYDRKPEEGGKVRFVEVS